jgi:hypothetical protein
MRLRCLFFAASRELAGCRETELEVPEPCTAGEALDLLLLRFPKVASLRPSLQVAVNHKYTPLDTPVTDGDELALIPPISGG